MIDLHELEQARKDFAYIAAQKDVEEWQQWEEWKKTQKEAKIIILNEEFKHNPSKIGRTSQEGIRS